MGDLLRRVTTLGSLNSLAEVGIAINLTFTLAPQVRDLLTMQLKSTVRTLSIDLTSAINNTELDGTQALEAISKVEPSFVSATQRWAPGFITSAIISALTLLGLLVCAAHRPDTPCSWHWPWIAIFFALGPVTLWIFTIALIYRKSRKSLGVWQTKFKDALETWQMFKKKKIDPTSPSGAPPNTNANDG